MLDFARIAIATGGLDGIARASAIDQDAFLAMCLTRLGKGRIDAGFIGHIAFAENAADFLGDLLALFLLQVENRDLGPLGRKRASGRFAQARCTAGYHCGGIGTYFHVKFLLLCLMRLKAPR